MKCSAGNLVPIMQSLSSRTRLVEQSNVRAIAKSLPKYPDKKFYPQITQISADYRKENAISEETERDSNVSKPRISSTDQKG
jgi:hypothetical protein